MSNFVYRAKGTGKKWRIVRWGGEYLMPHHPRIECSNITNFTTVRTIECKIWFNCNSKLEESILGYLAQCCDRYGVKLYAFALEGTHKHELADFPNCNRASFFRDFNSAVTRAVKRHQKYFTGGPMWARRYSNEFIPMDKDIEDKFFYTVLQPVQDGLVRCIEEYPGYNCFYDAIRGVEREYAVVDWARYNAEKRWKKDINIEDYTRYYKLKYSRLPGYEDMEQAEYERMMIRKLRERTKEIVRKRKKGFLGKKRLLSVRAGTKAKNPKYSDRWDYRPRVLCSCPETFMKYTNWYLEMIYKFDEASRAYRYGEEYEGVAPNFPPGMYKPPNFTCEYKVTSGDLN